MDTRNFVLSAVLLLGGLVLVACNTSGLSEKPRGTFSQLACLDVNGDSRINTDDASDPSKLPDFDADGKHDGDDAEFVKGVDIPLNPIAKDTCNQDLGGPEFLVTHDYFASANVDCGGGEQAVLIMGVGGGVDNLKNKDQAAGVRKIVDSLISANEDEDRQTIGVIAGPAITDAENAATAMEDWLTNAVRVYLDRFPCARAVLVGFSHGGVSVDVVAAKLEGEYADRFIAVVHVDRIDGSYGGDLVSFPSVVPVLNVYQTNEVGLSGRPYDQSNVVNFDASGEKGPKNGEDGGPLEPVRHTTMDNSESVRKWIVDQVMQRS
ncbi:MAG: hypothetical protein HY873_02950 [Chloroflexi bacterium]|nr:hypothetical protein [Chloroflexota bacterium]